MVGQLPYLTYTLHRPWMSTKGYVLLDWITLYHCVQSSGVKGTSTKQFPVQVGGICWPTQKQGDKGLDYLSSGYYISCQVTYCQKDTKLVFCFSCCKVKQEDAQGKLKHAYPWELPVQVEEKALFFRYVRVCPTMAAVQVHTCRSYLATCTRIISNVIIRIKESAKRSLIAVGCAEQIQAGRTPYQFCLMVVFYVDLNFIPPRAFYACSIV